MKSLFRCLTLLLMAAVLAHADAPATSQTFAGYLSAHGYYAVKVSTPPNANCQYIKVFVNGHAASLAVDTGSPITLLTDECARDFGLTVQITKKHLAGIGGVVSGDYGIAAIQSFKLQFGDINHTSALYILPRNANLPPGADGLFGADFLALNAAILPVGGKGILFRPGPVANVPVGDYMAKSSFTGVPMNAGHGGIWVTGYLNGKPLDLRIDSGAEFTLFHKASVTPILRPKELDSTRFAETGLDGRDQKTVYFTPESLTLGHFDISHQTFLASDAAIFEKEKFDGLVGYDLLGQHKAVIDFGDGMLWLH